MQDSFALECYNRYIMPLTANDSNGRQVYSWQVPDDEKRKQYFCRDCSEQVSFVDATLRTKHFRHRVDSTCQSESETEEHIYYKRLVFEGIGALGIGTPHLEYWIDDRKADVHWEKEYAAANQVVFEIQATNYDISVYERKIRYYAYRKMFVVYLFVGDGFMREVKDNVYSLWEVGDLHMQKTSATNSEKDIDGKGSISDFWRSKLRNRGTVHALLVSEPKRNIYII